MENYKIEKEILNPVIIHPAGENPKLLRPGKTIILLIKDKVILDYHCVEIEENKIFESSSGEKFLVKYSYPTINNRTTFKVEKIN